MQVVEQITPNPGHRERDAGQEHVEAAAAPARRSAGWKVRWGDPLHLASSLRPWFESSGSRLSERRGQAQERYAPGEHGAQRALSVIVQASRAPLRAYRHITPKIGR